MAEVKTQPITAQHVATRDEFRAKAIPGSFSVSKPDPEEENAQWFWYCCPCGCGAMAPIIVGNGFKPAEGPSWNWNGSLDKPTLTPSVHHRGHWHGWLTDGVWRSC